MMPRRTSRTARLGKRQQPHRSVTVAARVCRAAIPYRSALLLVLALSILSCTPGAAVEGGACEQASDCAEGLWCLGRVCRKAPAAREPRFDGPSAGRADAGLDSSVDAGPEDVTDQGPNNGRDVAFVDAGDLVADAGPETGADTGDDAYSVPDSGPGHYRPTFMGQRFSGLPLTILDSNDRDEYLFPTYGGTDCGFLGIEKMNADGCGISGAGTMSCNMSSQYHGAAHTRDGGMVLLGRNVEEFKSSSAVVGKLTRDGSLEWLNVYGQPSLGGDFVASIQYTGDSGYVVVGATKSFGGGKTDGWVFKLSSEGNVEWEKAIGGAGHDYFTVVRQSSDGGYLLAGATGYRPDEFPGQPWVVKLARDGDLEWERTLAGAGAAIAIRETADRGALVVTGQPHVGLLYLLSGQYGMAAEQLKWSSVVKLSSQGVLSWGKRFDLKTNNGFFSDAIPLRNGGYIASGCGSFQTVDRLWCTDNAMVMMLAEDGGVEWQRIYKNLDDSGDDANSVFETADSHVIFSNFSSFTKIDGLGQVEGDCRGEQSRPAALAPSDVPGSAVQETTSTVTAISRPVANVACETCRGELLVFPSFYNAEYGYSCPSSFYLKDGCLERVSSLPFIVYPAGVQYDFRVMDNGCPASTRAVLTVANREPQGNPLSLVSAEFLPPGDFVFLKPLVLPTVIPSGKTAEIEVAFSPHQPGYADGVLRLGGETVPGLVSHLDVPLRGWSADGGRPECTERWPP